MENTALFQRALSATTILKYSDEEVGKELAAVRVPRETIVIRTQGAQGLTVSQGLRSTVFPALAAPHVVDTSGAGDMVTVGVIHYLLGESQLQISWI